MIRLQNFPAAVSWKRYSTGAHAQRLLLVLTLAALMPAGAPVPATAQEAPPFPAELTQWVPLTDKPVFSGAGGDAWDQKIRERGWIIIENGTWHLFYTGYNPEKSPRKFLGHATSPDGLAWTRDPANPLLESSWVEDMCVIHKEDTYYMFAEGENDFAHLLTSTDAHTWQEQGPLDVRLKDGTAIPSGPYGTPAVWLENGTWYLFYERGDQGVWLATSTDARTWTNVQDEPVLAMGPAEYDQTAVAFNQVFKRGNWYYAVYHANSQRPWKNWTTCMARSTDLIHWQKFAGNPLVQNNQSSGIVVDPDGPEGPQPPRLYTMHPEVRVLVPGAEPTGAPGQTAVSPPQEEAEDLHTQFMRATVKISHDQSTGTGFILNRPTDGRWLVVTAAHVFDNTPGEETALIFHAQQADGGYQKQPFKLPLRKEGKLLYTKHPTEDVAVIAIEPPQNVNLPRISTDLIATDALSQAHRVGPGTEVAYLGFPHREESGPDGFPILRDGPIASFPLVPSAKYKTLYLSTNSFEGDSGGPVFLARPSKDGRQPGLILGLITGQRFLDEELRGIYGVSKNRYRLGLAVVIQAPFIGEAVKLLP